MLDITKLLQNSIYFDNRLLDERDLPMGPERHLQEIMVRFSQALAHAYVPKVNYSVAGSDPALDHDQQLARYTEAMHWLLLFSARKQWTHLLVMDKAAYQRIIQADPSQDFNDFDKEYLTILNLVMNAYYTHQQDYFRHAWHLFLKLGLVDWQLSEQEIIDCHNHLLEKLK